jgi:hypothetical protein
MQLLVQIKNLRVVRGFQGQRVVLMELSSKELNGKVGMCGAFNEKHGRYAVTLVVPTYRRWKTSRP